MTENLPAQELTYKLDRTLGYLHGYLTNYRWDLPAKLLLPRDPDYHKYICRGNIGQGILARVSNFSDFLLEDSQKRIMDDFCNRIKALYGPGMRTETDMKEIRKLLEEIILFLEKI